MSLTIFLANHCSFFRHWYVFTVLKIYELMASWHLGSPQLRRREMTSSVIRKYALAALCGAAIVGVGQSAQAATWDINGGVAPVSTATYGTAPGDNNVINNPSGAAGVYDTLGGTSVIAAANLLATFTAGNTYTVSY